MDYTIQFYPAYLRRHIEGQKTKERILAAIALVGWMAVSIALVTILA